MSQRTRGQETTIRIAVDSRTQEGSFFKVIDWTTTARSELVEQDFLGEQETDLDFQHGGFDFAWSIHEQDRKALDLMAYIIELERAHQAHPDITITVIHQYRNGNDPLIEIFYSCFIKVGELGFSGRTEYNTIGFEGKAKRQKLIGRPA